MGEVKEPYEGGTGSLLEVVETVTPEPAAAGKAGRHRQKTGCPDRAGEDRGRGLPCRSFGRKKTGRR